MFCSVLLCLKNLIDGGAIVAGLPSLILIQPSPSISLDSGFSLMHFGSSEAWRCRVVRPTNHWWASPQHWWVVEWPIMRPNKPFSELFVVEFMSQQRRVRICQLPLGFLGRPYIRLLRCYEIPPCPLSPPLIYHWMLFHLQLGTWALVWLGYCCLFSNPTPIYRYGYSQIGFPLRGILTLVFI